MHTTQELWQAALLDPVLAPQMQGVFPSDKLLRRSHIKYRSSRSTWNPLGRHVFYFTRKQWIFWQLRISSWSVWDARLYFTKCNHVKWLTSSRHYFWCVWRLLPRQRGLGLNFGFLFFFHRSVINRRSGSTAHASSPMRLSHPWRVWWLIFRSSRRWKFTARIPWFADDRWRIPWFADDRWN